MSKRKVLFPLLATVLVAGLVMAGCKSGSTDEKQTAASPASATAEAAEANTVLPGLDGTDVTLAQYKGKVVLVNFWATWCAPCKKEIPWLIEFNEKYGPQGFAIIGVAMDDEGKKVVEPWVRDQRFDVNGKSEPMNYKIVLGNDKIADKFGNLIGLPTSYLYGRDGKKFKTIIGGFINHDDLPKALEGKL